MKLHELKPEHKLKSRNRVGRGPGSGNGKTAGRGQDGQNSRSGGGVRLDLKVVKCHYSDVFQKEDLQIGLKNNTKY